MPKLSVIVPVYNASAWLRETIDSVINQKYTDWELILVDDESRDDSADIIKEYSHRDERIKYIFKKNGGVSSARNVGIENAKGEYIVFLDSDDIALPDMYSTLIERIEANNTDAEFCAFTRFFKNGKTLTHIEPSFAKLEKDPRDIRSFLFSTAAVTEGDKLVTDDIHGACWRSVYRKSIILNNGLRFNTNIRFAEDQVFVIKYLYNCSSVGYTDAPLILYRAQTKEWRHHDLYDSNMELLKEQLKLIEQNTLYSKKEKKNLQSYCKYSIYMAVINEDLMFKDNAYEIIKGYGKDFRKLLTFGGFVQKMKVKFSFKKLILFVMLKLKMYKTVQKLFPNKRY